MMPRMVKYSPVRPDFNALHPGSPVVRAVLATANARAVEFGQHPEQIARAMWPGDTATLTLITRGTTVVATTTTSGWAAELAQFGLADLLLNMGPASAASELLKRALALDFNQRSVLVIPSMVPASGNVGFVGQGSPIPVRQLSIGGAALQLQKLATILVFTRELLNSSSAETAVRTIMNESIGLALDSLMLDATAATGTRPAGLRAGVAATATAEEGTGAMMSDLATLASAVAGVGGLDIAFVADPKSAVKMAFNVGPKFTFPILASKSLSAGTVLCIAVPALCAIIDPTPEISVSNAATVEMVDAPSTGGVMAGDPVRSFFQTDTIGIKFETKMSWCLRADNAVAWMTSINWRSPMDDDDALIKAAKLRVAHGHGDALDLWRLRVAERRQRGVEVPEIVRKGMSNALETIQPPSEVMSAEASEAME
jgi:hypothetical protein